MDFQSVSRYLEAATGAASNTVGSNLLIEQRSDEWRIRFPYVPAITVCINSEENVTVLLDQDDPGSYNDESVPEEEWESGFADFHVEYLAKFDRAVHGSLTSAMRRQIDFTLRNYGCEPDSMGDMLDRVKAWQASHIPPSHEIAEARTSGYESDDEISRLQRRYEQLHETIFDLLCEESSGYYLPGDVPDDLSQAVDIELLRKQRSQIEARLFHAARGYISIDKSLPTADQMPFAAD